VASENETRLPQNEDVRLLQALAQQAGIAITNAQLFQEVSDSRERLQRLAGRLAEMQEGERRRLAHDLHEDIGQVLASLGIRVELAERQWEAACGADAGGAAANAHAAARAELSGARQVINGLIEYVRDVAEELRPAELDDLGLVPSLSNYFERFTAQTGVQVDFRHSQVDERYGDRLETAVFRIVQNALQNVAQHAGTAQAVVRLWRSSGHLELQVHDQGCGFDLQQTLAAQPCIGLVEMTERASAYGGRLEVDTAVGNGTRVTADFPLPEPADTASTA
ncbi:MAG: sensor histidine kinase, partial [Chloroflexota bacterium]